MKKLIISLMLLLTMATGSSGGVLIKNPVNPRYLAHAGSSEAVYLTGSHTWNLVQSDDSNPATYKALEDYLDWVQSFGHNFVRVWANWSYLSYEPHPWNTTGSPAKAVMGDWNSTYWDALAERVNQITRRGMYCGVTVFGSGVKIRDEWSGVWWNPDNNTSSALAAAFSTTDGSTFYTTNTAALNIQKAFAAKVIDTLNAEENIIWEIINEAHKTSNAWQETMAAYIRSYESTKPLQHLIWRSSYGGDSHSNNDLLNSSADVISPQGLTPYTISEGGSATYTSKVVIMDSDHMSTGYSDPALATDYRKWVWRVFTRGNHPIFMDSYDDYIPYYNPDAEIQTVFDPVREAMGHTKAYADLMEMKNVTPSSTFSSSGYALVNAGKTYLIYQPNKGSFTYMLPSGNYNFEWFNPNTGAVTSTGTMKGAKKIKSVPPIGYSDAVLFIERQTP